MVNFYGRFSRSPWFSKHVSVPTCNGTSHREASLFSFGGVIHTPQNEKSLGGDVEAWGYVDYTLVKVDGDRHSPKVGLVRDHDKPRLMGVAPSTFQVVFYVDDYLGPANFALPSQWIREGWIRVRGIIKMMDRLFTHLVPKFLASPKWYTPVNQHITLEHAPFEDVSPAKNGDFPASHEFSGRVILIFSKVSRTFMSWSELAILLMATRSMARKTSWGW